MATALLLRHGRTRANAEGVLAGWSDVGLDDAGADQATAVAERLRDVPLVLALTSPLRRCRETVELVLAVRDGLDVRPDDRIGECRYGEWEGRPLKELAREDLWPVVQHHPSGAAFPGEGAEPLAISAARAVAAVREVDARVTAEHGPDAVWLACTHGDVIKAVAADALGLHLDLFQRIVVDPCSVTAIRYTPLRPFLLRSNDTGGDLTTLVRRERTSDAAVGGGAGVAAASDTAEDPADAATGEAARSALQHPTQHPAQQAWQGPGTPAPDVAEQTGGV